MGWPENAIRLYQSQCDRYPKLQVEDLLKALHQSIYGGCYLTRSPIDAAERTQTEAVQSQLSDDSYFEQLSDQFYRVHLDYLHASGLCADTLATLAALSSQQATGCEKERNAMLETVLIMANSGSLKFSYKAVLEAVRKWEEAGFSAPYHSETFRNTYAPSYRILRSDYVWALPVFAQIDKMLAENSHLLIAIEGGAAAGKSTFGALLRRVYDCNLFHMNDFFLRPKQRSAARYRRPGGNVDYERFREEVLQPLLTGTAVQYRRFDCRTFQLDSPIEIGPKAINVVEGSYSCHPYFENAYDLRIFLKISPELQARRIRKYSSPALQARFFEQWILMENAYFEAMKIEQSCDLVLNVQE